MDDLFPDTIDKARHGATWFIGGRECRNWRGYFQSREAGGNWCFQVPWFSNDNKTCTVYIVDQMGNLQKKDGIPVDDKGRISIEDKKYSRAFWNH